jgi:hypothetical protein
VRRTIAITLSATAITLGTAAGTALLTAAAAQADTASCIEVLLYNEVENTVGNEICQVTEFLGDTAAPGYAGMPCELAMHVVVGIPEEIAREACDAAVAPA